MSGRLISFEGADGCGKTTQLRRLAERLRGTGKFVRELREPGGTPLAEEIRHILKHSAAGSTMTAESELLLVNAARAQLVREVIRPALERKEWVLCDRYADSTLAYQAWGRGLDREWVRRVTDFAIGPTRPHLTLLLWVPVEVGLARRRDRLNGTAEGGDRFEAAGPAFFEKVHEGYRAIAAEEPERVRVIDAAPAIEHVHQVIWSWVEPLLSQPRWE